MTDEQKTQTEGELKLPSAQELLEAGVHFGHKTSSWHPKMANYIFSTKGDAHVLDLEKTLAKLSVALIFMKGILSRGGMILFAGLKPAAKQYIKETAQTLELPYVNERWLGGTLTNFKTVAKRLQYYRELEEQKASGQWDKILKKERVQLQKKLTKLDGQLFGIKKLMRLPEAIFVADVKASITAIKEARKIGIPVIAICDTNVDPTLVDYPIPANDDAAPALKIIMDNITENLRNIKPIVVVEKQSKEK